MQIQKLKRGKEISQNLVLRMKTQHECIYKKNGEQDEIYEMDIFRTDANIPCVILLIK